MGSRKRNCATGSSIFRLHYNRRNLTNPHSQIFQSSDAPRYRNGFTAHFCLYVLFNALLGLTRFILVRRNAKKRAQTAATSPSSGEGEQIQHYLAFQDLTDKENPDFRVRFHVSLSFPVVFRMECYDIISIANGADAGQCEVCFLVRKYAAGLRSPRAVFRLVLLDPTCVAAADDERYISRGDS